MKRFTVLAAVIAAAFCALSCNKEEVPVVQFDQVIYSVYSRGEVSCALSADKQLDKDITVQLSFGGTAKASDYIASTKAVTIPKGSSGASFTIKDNGLSADGQVSISIEEGGGYSVGVRRTCVVNLDVEEELVYTFTGTTSDLYESTALEIKISGVHSGANYAAPDDLSVPLTLEGEATDAVQLSSESIIIPKGGNSASVILTLKEGADQELTKDARIKVGVDRGKASRFIPGEIATVTVKLHSGLQVPARLVGTWKFKEVYNLEEIEFFFGDEDADDPDLLPTHNEGFTLTFTEDEDGNVTLKPGDKGDLTAYFRECEVTLTAPKNICPSPSKVLGNYTAEEYNMFMGEVGIEKTVNTYYSLSKVNRAFSKSEESIGAGVIAFRLTDDGNLEMHLRDYDTPPFGFFWWDDSKFDAEMFGFSSLFSKAE